MNFFASLLGVSLFITSVFPLQKSCFKKHFDKHDSFVCVCNSTHCDPFDAIEHSSKITMFTTDKLQDRFVKHTLQFNVNGSKEGQIVTINREKKLQSILGFGGAFTDASGLNMLKLGTKLSENILREYYGPTGLMYSMGRVPIGGSDFSTHPYTYDDSDSVDFNLTNFKLTMEDYKYKIPFIKLAQKATNSTIKLFASPWSPPAWMKTNHKLNGKGTIKGKPDEDYYKTWANYIVKFLDEYKKNSVEFWGLTIQNEPWDGDIDNFTFNCNAMSAEQQRDFLYQTLGPALKDSGYTKDVLKIMILDDQRPFILKWADVILIHQKAAEYVSGIAFHWYFNAYTSTDVLDQVHDKYPDYFLLSSEACEGSSPLEIEKVSMGDWQRAENYAYDIIKDLQHHTNGWIDWNMALDMQGGPNWSNNFVDAPIIVNEETKEYYKQPMYYALAHFTRFLTPGSVRLETNTNDELGLDFVVFQNSINHSLSAIVLNRYESNIPLTIMDPKHGNISILIGPKSIQTIVWFD